MKSYSILLLLTNEYYKEPSQECLTQENLQNQMQIVVCGPEFSKFDPLPAVHHWLRSGYRHIQHKQPTRKSANHIGQCTLHISTDQHRC